MRQTRVNFKEGDLWLAVKFLFQPKTIGEPSRHTYHRVCGRHFITGNVQKMSCKAGFYLLRCKRSTCNLSLLLCCHAVLFCSFPPFLFLPRSLTPSSFLLSPSLSLPLLPPPLTHLFVLSLQMISILIYCYPNSHGLFLPRSDIHNYCTTIMIMKILSLYGTRPCQGQSTITGNRTSNLSRQVRRRKWIKNLREGKKSNEWGNCK